MKKAFCGAIFCFSVLLAAGVILNSVSYAEPAVQIGLKGWKEWIDDKKDYLGKVESLMQESKEAAIQQDADLKEAIDAKDQAAGEKIIGETSKKLFAIVAELKLLNPPEEFKDYHEKVIEAYRYRQMANEATLKRDIANIKSYGNMSMAYEIEAMECIKKLYISRGAPQALVNSIDHGIDSYRQRLTAN